MRGAFGLRSRRRFLAAQTLQPHGRRKHCHQLAPLPGLGQKVCGTCLDGAYHFGSIAIGSHHDNSQVLVYLQHIPEQLEPLLAAYGVAGEVHVHQY